MADSALKITLDARAFTAAVDTALERLQAMQRSAPPLEPLPVVVASAAAAAIGCAKRVDRRSFFRLRLW